MRLLALWGPVILVMGLIFTSSAMPDPGPPPAGISDKTAHMVAYSALGAALLRALAEGQAGAMTPVRVAAAAVLAVLYGVSDELHQHFVPGRTPDALDLAADAGGGLAGAAALAVLSRARERRRQRRAASRAGR